MRIRKKEWISRIKNRLKEKKNFKIQVFLVIMLTGYTIFFTSSIWFPQGREFIEATPYYTAKTYEDYRLYLTQWVLEEESHTMQVIVEYTDSGLTNQELAFKAVDKTYGTLQLEVMLQEADYAVLRIYDVPEKWTEIALRVGIKGGTSNTNFYTNADSIVCVEKLTEESETDYKLARLSEQLTYDQKQIDQKNKKIKKLEEENQSMQERIQILNEKEYLSEKEAKVALETVARAEQSVKSNQEKIKDFYEEIAELEERSEIIRQKMEQIKTGEGEAS